MSTSAQSPSGVVIIAHRGYAARAPENTLAALDAALDAGATSVEWDLRVAACGTPVLFHDEALDRTTDASGPLDALTADELAELDAGSWFDDGFAGEPVPTLRQALETVSGRVEGIYPEVKAYRSVEELDDMTRLVQEAGLAHRTTFISMDWDALERIGGSAPEVELGFIVEDARHFAAGLERAAGREGALLDLDYRIVLTHPSFAREAAARDVELAVWTVDHAEDAERLLDRGVRRITTNEVERLLHWARLR